MSFSANIVNFGKKTTAEIERLRRGVTLKLFSAVIEDTPVDTGRLRGNWRCSIGAPNLATIEREDKSGEPTKAEAVKVIMESAGDTTVNLANNLPYAARVEYDGWSHTKAPEGMVRKNVTRFVRLLKEEAAKNK